MALGSTADETQSAPCTRVISTFLNRHSNSFMFTYYARCVSTYSHFMCSGIFLCLENTIGHIYIYIYIYIYIGQLLN